MSEDKLEQALEAMKNEDVSPEQLAEVRARVWKNLENPVAAACAEFRVDFAGYLEGELPGKRSLLMDDHLSRCAQCRAQLAELKGESRVAARELRSASRWGRWGSIAAAAAIACVAFYLGRDTIDRLLAPWGPRATITSISGPVYRVPEGTLQTGAALGEGEVFRTGPGARAVLRLADGSVADVNERTELYVSSAWSGQAIHLQRGDIILQAAKQRRGHLRVLTRDSVASVKGTVLAVSSGLSGTVVSVVEGRVEVAQPGVEVVLTQGQQAASNPMLESSVREAVSWSPDAETYTALLASFDKIQKQIAELPTPALRTQSRLLQYLPPNAMIYGAVPNLGGTLSQAVLLAEQQSAENPVFRSWWNSHDGQELKQIMDLLQAVTPLLGDEIVYVYATQAAGMSDEIPMVAAEVVPGKQAELDAGLSALRGRAVAKSGVEREFAPRIAYSVTGNLVLVSDTRAHLEWLQSHMGQGTATPFAAAIAERYRRGAGFLVGIDVEQLVAVTADDPAPEFVGAEQMKHLFVEQRSGQGVEQNEVTLTFKGPRMGMASWLAGSGSGGAAEYLSSDVVLAVYASTREPRQLFDEMTTQIAKMQPSFAGELGEVEAHLGVHFAADLAAAVGTESAIGLEGLSVNGPVWVMAVLANNPGTIDSSVGRIVDVFNSRLGPADQDKRITLERENADGRTWTTLKTQLLPLSIAWTYDRGYLVAASDRGTGTRAIATRNGGSPLLWSPAFQQQLPSSVGLHPSAFAWLNTKGAFQGLAALVTNPTLQKLMTERDPILVVFSGNTEQIHVASRTRLSGLIVDAMLLKRLGGVHSDTGAVLRGIR